MKIYIGDSVYLTVQADGFWLMTINDLNGPSNKIFLDWSVHKNLNMILKEIVDEHQRHSKE